MKKLFIEYYRVSRDEQGKSGLGLAGQRKVVKEYVSKYGMSLREFEDVESGKNNDREGLNQALSLCKEYGATLIAYDLTRISRGGYAMMNRLEKSGIEYISAIAPNESDFSKSIKFVVAKEEADRISRNTSKALQAIKDKLDRGEVHISKKGAVVKRLGSPRPITDKAREAGLRVRVAKAKNNPDNIKATAFIVALVEQGISFYAITNKLNESGFKTSRGNNFSKMQTKRLYDRWVKNK